MSEIKFANGLIFKRSDNAPEFVIGGLSIKKSEFIPFLNAEQGDWVNLSIKLSKAGKYYVELDLWKPKKEVKNEIPDVAPSTNDDLPF
jgi:hypothetical protein